MTLQELSDRAEIQDLIVDYAHAVDSHRWDDLDALFTPDATLDFTATGGAAGDLPTIKAFFEQGAEPVRRAPAPRRREQDQPSTRTPPPHRRSATTRCGWTATASRRSSRSASGTTTPSCAPPTAGGSRRALSRRVTCTAFPAAESRALELAGAGRVTDDDRSG